MTSPAPLARWWREPWWARISLTIIVAGFVVLTCWNLARGGDFSFYEASARSMSQSWHALFFGAFDPDATVTLDKLSGFAVPQALSIRLFGMSISAIALPQVIEGVVAVVACAVLALRWGGRGAGLLAAGAAASTPIFVSMFAHPMEDGLLTMALAVALVWWQRAILTSARWPLVLCAVFIGVGFQAKMMAAWFLLPALIAGTLAATRGWRRGLVRAGAVTAAAVAASVAWITVVALVPADARPYVDGSTNDSIFAMVFGYNGLDRFVPGAVPGSVGASSSTGGLGATLAAVSHALLTPAPSSSGGSPTLTKLLELPLVTQIGWLYPAALAGIVLGLWRYFPRRGSERAPSTSARFPLVVVAAVWFATAATVLTFTHVPHTAYVAALGVPMVLLVVVAWVEGMRLLRSRRRRDRLVLPAVVGVQAVWWGVLIGEARLPAVLLVPAIVVGAISLALGIAVALPEPGSLPRLRRVAPAALAVALLCLPVATSLQVLDDARDGSGGDAYVGVTARGGHPDETFTVSTPSVWGGIPQMSPAVTQIVDAARQHGGGADGSPLFVTDSWALSSQVIDATGASVLTDGGYSGHVPVFTTDDLEQMVRSGHARLFVVASGAPEGDPVRRVATGPGCHEVGEWDFSQAKEGGDVSKVSGATLYQCTGA
ncbi:glycosyltransferase family 39 protein [Microbacterium testaceum]|uniref:glycosyltransferase family 39 protein n=1 Tax=Microbacterium testaceum TaxID=2033 RepID=UPI0012465F64|nr:glycosyltransferase family 39 protein [Microbacterium testaceum]